MTGFEIAVTCLALNVFKEARGGACAGPARRGTGDPQ